MVPSTVVDPKTGERIPSEVHPAQGPLSMLSHRVIGNAPRPLSRLFFCTRTQLIWFAC